MNQLLAIVLLTTFSLATLAETEDQSLSSKLAMPSENALARGRMEIGGGFSATTRVSKSNKILHNYFVHPSLEYFVTDTLSLGGSISLNANEEETTVTNYWGLGPSLTYYFSNKGSRAFYFKQTVSYYQAEAYVSSDGSSDTYDAYWTIGSSTLGTKFFLHPQLAFGIGLEYGYNFSGHSYSDRQIGLVGSFSFYY
jgi:hypothetical protein